MDFLTELEDKIDNLITLVKKLKEENTDLKDELEQNVSRVSELEKANKELSNTLDSLKSRSEGHQEKLDLAAQKIQGIISKLELVSA